MAYTAPEIDLAAPVGVLPAGSSYLDVVDANVYFSNSFNNAAWSALTAAQQTVALAEATRWLETLCWKGEKCDPAQGLSWPRKIDADGCCAAAVCTTLPEKIIQATAELALALQTNQTAIVGGVATAATGAVQTQKLGDLSISYFNPADSGKTAAKYGPNAPLVLQKFPWVGDLLSCYANTSGGGARIIARVRS